MFLVSVGSGAPAHLFVKQTIGVSMIILAGASEQRSNKSRPGRGKWEDDETAEEARTLR